MSGLRRRAAWTSAVVLSLLVWATAAQLMSGVADAAPNDKVTICHLPPGNPDNPQTIDVGESSVQAHLDHGDSLGPCGSATTTSTTSTTTTTTSTPPTTDPTTTSTTTTTTTTTTPSPGGQPVAAPIAIRTDCDTPASGTVASSVRGGTPPFTYVLRLAPTHGFVLLGEDGGFDYAPTVGFDGIDSFVFTAADSRGNLSNEATVTIRVEGTCVAPGPSVLPETTILGTTTTVPGAAVLGVTIVRGDAASGRTRGSGAPPPATVLGISITRGSLARTGTAVLPIALAGLVLLLCGLTFVRAARKD